MTVRVRQVLGSRNPIVLPTDTMTDAILKMTESGFGCVTVVNTDGSIVGVFTDGDLRRAIQTKGKEALNMKMSDISFKTPVSIDADALLYEAQNLFKSSQVDNILVTDQGKPVGILDIQDLNKTSA